MHAGWPSFARGKDGRRFALARVLRSVVAPLVIALPPLFWVADATHRASPVSYTHLQSAARKRKGRPMLDWARIETSGRQ